MTSDHCISRSVRDSAQFLAITEDATTFPPLGYVAQPSARRLRIAAWTRTMTNQTAEPAVLAAFEDAAALLADLGHQVEYVVSPFFEAEPLSEAFFVVAGSSVANIVARVDGSRGMPVQEHELEPFTWALLDMCEALGPEALVRARSAFQRAARTYLAATSGFDVVLTPTLAMAPWKLGYLSPVLERAELMLRTARAVGYTPIHNIVGSPAMSVPLYFPEGGLPIGTQLAARPGADGLLLGLAYELERARPWRDRWPRLAFVG